MKEVKKVLLHFFHSRFFLFINFVFFHVFVVRVNAVTEEKSETAEYWIYIYMKSRLALIKWETSVKDLYMQQKYKTNNKTREEKKNGTHRTKETPDRREWTKCKRKNETETEGKVHAANK